MWLYVDDGWMKTVQDYLISTLTAFCMVWDEYGNYLVNIKELMKISSRRLNAFIIRKFPNMFKKKYRNYCCIKEQNWNRIISNATSILIILYTWMELEELKRQIVRLKNSSYKASIQLIRGKDTGIEQYVNEEWLSIIEKQRVLD